MLCPSGSTSLLPTHLLTGTQEVLPVIAAEKQPRSTELFPKLIQHPELLLIFLPCAQPPRCSSWKALSAPCPQRGSTRYRRASRASFEEPKDEFLLPWSRNSTHRPLRVRRAMTLPHQEVWKYPPGAATTAALGLPAMVEATRSQACFPSISSSLLEDAGREDK